MNFPWNNVFDYFCDRGRGALFFRSLIAFFIMFLLGALADEIVAACGWQDDIVYLIPGLGFVIAVWFCLALRRASARRKQRYQSTPLSRDELSKARSKLMGRQTGTVSATSCGIRR